MRTRRWIAALCVPVLLLAADAIVWRLATARLTASLQAEIAHARREGWTIRYDNLSSGGWPDSALLRIENLSVETALPGGAALRWGSNALSIRARLSRPDIVTIVPEGPHALEIGGGPPIPITAVQPRLTVTLGLAAALRAEAESFAAAIPGAGRLELGHVQASADFDLDAGRDKPAVTFAFSTSPVTLPDHTKWSLGHDIRAITCDGVLNGPIPLSTTRGLTGRATAWRDAGGSLDIRKVSIGWGPATVEASATLALDEDLQPMGAGSGKISGFDAALDALAAGGVLTRSGARAAKAVLSLLADTPAGGQPEEVEVPLTLQFRTLSVRQVPLLRLPELEWPGP